FTRIIRRELPGRLVWRSADVGAFLTIAPIRPGHVLVVPVAEIDRGTDVPGDLWAETSRVEHTIGGGVQGLIGFARGGLIVAGLEVPHCHIHLVPIRSEADLDVGKADPHAAPAALDEAAERIRSALQAAGHTEAVA